MADVSQIRLPNGDTFDLIDEKSGYITAQYIENKTDYSIPVSRVGEIVVGETAIGTDSTNFPTSKAVVDYVDERVVQEIEAIDVGVTGIKANGTSLTVENGVVNIPIVGPNQTVGLMTDTYMGEIYNYIDNVSSSIPTSTSQLANDSGFITSETDPTVPAWAKASTKPTYTAAEVGALSSNTVIPQIFEVDYNSSTNTANKTYAEIGQAKNHGDLVLLTDSNGNRYYITSTSIGYLFTTVENLTSSTPTEGYNAKIKQLQVNSSNAWTVKNYKLPRKTSDLTNDSGYLTSSDIASVLTYKGTKASYSALPSSGNSTGDVWHVTDTGAEYAWDGSVWQELGTAIDLSNYLTTSDIADWAKQSSKPTYTAAEVGALPASTTIPTKTSDLTNDSGFITSYTDEKVKSTTWSGDTFYIVGTTSSSTSTGTLNKHDSFKVFVSNDSSTDGLTQLSLGNSTAANTAGAKYGEILIYSNYVYCVKLRAGANTQPGLTGNRTIYLPDKTGTIALTSDIPDTSSFLTSETDPVFSASAAAGITSTDISNWNAKVSDTGKWNDVSLNKTSVSETGKETVYVPLVTSLSSTAAYFMRATFSNGTKAGSLARYNADSYLISTTPSANDNSTKVATTAYVDSAVGGITIPTKTSELTNDSGFITSYTDEKVTTNVASNDIYYLVLGNNTTSAETKYYDDDLRYQKAAASRTLFIGDYTNSIEGTITFYTDNKHYVSLTPITGTTSSGKIYLPNPGGTLALTSDIPQVYSSTNTGGYLTMATLPIYDGTVE